MKSFYKKLTQSLGDSLNSFKLGDSEEKNVQSNGSNPLGSDAKNTPGKSSNSSKKIEKLYLDTVLQTRSKLMAALLRMLSKEEAEEVVQEAYLKLFLKFEQEIPDNPSAYVYRLARNLAIDRLRSQQVADNFVQSQLTSYSESSQKIDPQLTCHDSQEKQLLLQAINSLPPICRQVFVLRKLHGKSHRDIADDLGISTKTVENHIHKGMQHCHNHVMRSQLASQSNKAKKLA